MTLLMPCDFELRKPSSEKTYKDYLKECSDYSNSPLIWAIVANEPFETIKQMVEEGADLDDKDKQGNNSLAYASAFHDSPELIRYLISNGLSVKRVDQIDAMTFAHYAAYNPNPEIMQTLIDCGVDFQKKDSFNQYTPLCTAVLEGSIEVCEVLLKAGSSLEKKDKDGNTALFLSVKNPNIDFFKLLLKYGAKIDVKNNNKQFLIDYVLRECNVERVREIAEILNITFDDSNYKEFKNNREKLSYIFEAILNKDYRVLDYLKSCGCNIFDGNKKKKVFSFALTNSSQPEMIDYLVQNGLSINDYDFIASNICKNSSFSVWKKILELGLPKNYQFENGCSLLMKIMELNSSSLSDERLLNLLCDEITVNIKDKDGRTACHYIVSTSSGFIQSIMHTMFEMKTIIYGNYILPILIKFGANINEKDNYGKTPLMIACKSNQTEVVNYLISIEVDVNEKDNFGNTALHYAAENLNIDMVKALIKKGANLTFINNEGLSAYKIAEEKLSSLNKSDSKNPYYIWKKLQYMPNPSILELLKGENNE